MKLAFYYHIPLALIDGKLTVPGYLGVFIDSLASEVNELFLVMHEANKVEAMEADYELKGKNIRWVNLGLKTPAWHRAIFHRKVLKEKMKEIEGCKAFIVRSPTPLAPYFFKYLNGPTLYFMVVGDYAEGLDHFKSKNFREYMIKLYLKNNDKLFRKEMARTNVMVNSPRLFEKYRDISKAIHQIRTTTLSVEDFYQREDTCLQDNIKILYTGRIDPAKGLFELIEAVVQLRAIKYPVSLHIVGWETDVNKPVETALLKKAAECGLSEHITFHGRKSVGPDLNAMYRMADLYVIASYQEGFPRTIWEALANSIPVIATKVGAIPDYLTHKQDAILIDPKSTDQISEALKTVINDSDLRRKMIENGQKIAGENTLEVQTKRIINIINTNSN